MAKILHHGELTSVFTVTDGKLDLKVDATGNVKLEKTAEGLKGSVTMPALPEVPVAFTGASIEGSTITLTKSDNSTATITLPAQPVDVKATNIELTGENKIKLTMSNGTVMEADVSTLIPTKTAEQLWNEIKALPNFKAELLTLIKGEEIQNFAGEHKGYLLATA